MIKIIRAVKTPATNRQENKIPGKEEHEKNFRKRNKFKKCLVFPDGRRRGK